MKIIARILKLFTPSFTVRNYGKNLGTFTTKAAAIAHVNHLMACNELFSCRGITIKAGK